MPAKRQIKTGDLNRYEDVIAAAINIEREMQRLSGLLDVGTFEEVMPILASIIKSAGFIRRTAIEQRREAYHDTIIE